MINIQDIVPFLDKGYVVMDSAERWFWEKYKPTLLTSVASWRANNRDCDEEVCLSSCFDIAPADDWTKSLIKVGGK